MYIVLPLFLALYIGQSFHYLTPFSKKFIQVCEEKNMNTAQPIRSEQELKDFMNFYEQVQYHPRNQLLLTMGLNTALRISDLLSLQWKQVYDLENRSVREHLLLVEAKTGKASNIYLNEKITVQLQKYYQF